MVRKYIMIPIEYAEIFLGLVCNYELKKGENKGCKCYGKLYEDNLCKADFKIDNWNIDYKSILIKSDDKIIEYSKKDNEPIYKKEVINNNNTEKIEKKNQYI